MSIVESVPTTPPDLIASPQALVAIRVRSGRSRADVAESAGLDRSQLWRIETGRAIPYPYTLQRLAIALGVPLSALLMRKPAEDAA